MISIVIPMFNEGERICPTLSEIEEFIRENPGLITEVVLVDDGSTDNCVERSMRYIERLPLRIERLSKNVGKWGAIHQGIKIAKNDAILLLDADGSASVYELERIQLLQTYLVSKIAVFGSRFMKGASVEGKSILRRVISHGYRLYVKWWYWYGARLTGISDMQTPFKLIHRSKIKMEKLRVKRFSGDIELAGNMTGHIVNHPVQFVHKAGGNIKTATIAEMAVETVQVALRLRRERLEEREERRRIKKDL